jgi:hypothetical protein
MAINAAFTDEVLTISCEVDISNGVAHSQRFRKVGPDSAGRPWDE